MSCRARQRTEPLVLRPLLQRTDDSTIADIAADRVYSGGLNNDGETLRLFDATGALVDWPTPGT